MNKQYRFVLTWGWDEKQNAVIWQKENDHVQVRGGDGSSSQDDKCLSKIILLQFPRYSLTVTKSRIVR